MNKAALALTAALALVACKDDDDNNTETNDNTATEEAAPAAPVNENMLQIAAGDRSFIVDLQGIEVILPTPQSYEGDMGVPAEGRLFNLDVKAFCPSLSGQVETMEEYTESCRDIVQNGNENKAGAQDLVTIFACRADSDAFYSPMPTLNYDSAYPFLNTDYEFNLEANFNPDRHFTEDGMIAQSERYGNDAFTVYNAEETGSRDISYAQEMRAYIEKRGGHTNHETQTPMCDAPITKNLGEPRPR